MAATPTTKSQLQAYRFILRRMEHALVRRDAVMLHDPMRTQMRSTAVGLVLGVLLMGGFALVSVFRPAADVSNDVILVGKTSLTTYVVQEEGGVRVLHPVLNLASARLVAGEPAPVSIVEDSALDGMPRGALLGIPGAPDLLPGPEDRPGPGWAVCDRLGAPTDASGSPAGGGAAPTTTTVLSGPPAGATTTLTAEQALFVRAPDGTDQLVFGGRRAVVDTSDAATTRVLGLSGAEPRPVGAGLLNSVPELPALGVPTVPRAGAVPAVPVGDAVVGDVVEVAAVGGTEYYLVLDDGVQLVDPLVAGLLVSSTGGFRDFGTDLMSQVPDSTRVLDLGRFPARAPTVVDEENSAVVCLRWEAVADDTDGTARASATTEVVVADALPLPDDARVVPFVRPGDGGAVLADSFYGPPGDGAVVQIRAPGQPAGAGTRYLVTDTGTRYGIDTAETAGVLGLGEQAGSAPASILSLLPQGPALDPDEALRAHNSVRNDAEPPGR